MLKLTKIEVSAPLKKQLIEAEESAIEYELSTAEELNIYHYGILVMALKNATKKDSKALEAERIKIEEEIINLAKENPSYLLRISNIMKRPYSTIQAALRALVVHLNKTGHLEKNQIPSA